MFHSLLSSHDSWLWLALDISAKATLLLAVAGAVAIMLGRSSAALRHRVWALSFVALLLLPVAGSLLPGLAWQVIPQDWQSVADARQDEAQATEPASTGDLAPSSSAVMRATSDSPFVSSAERDRVEFSQQSDMVAQDEATVSQLGLAATVQVADADSIPQNTASRSAASWLKIYWAIGVCMVVAPLLGGILGNWRLERRSQRVAETAWRELLDQLRNDLALHRDVALLLAGAGQMPMTFGFFRPAVVLPADAQSWTAERRRVVLLHELAHIKRYDVPWQMIARVACAIYWFHPLAWWALRQMRIDREHACDDCVLAVGQRASSYATHLLEIARAHRCPSPLANAALSMAWRSQLEGRLLAVLDAHRRRTPLGRSKSFVLLFSVIFAVIALGMIRPALKVESAALAATTTVEKPTASEDQNPTNEDGMVVKGVVLSPQGEPVAGAQVEFLSMSDNSGWPVHRIKKQKIGYRKVSTDSTGRFDLTMPRAAPGKFPALWAIVSAEELGPSQHWLEAKRLNTDIEIKLAASKTIRVQLVDGIGEPVVGIEPKLWMTGASGYGDSFWLPDPDALDVVTMWPKWTVSDAEGYTSTVLGNNTESVYLLASNERFGSQIVRFKITDEPMAVMLRPGLQVTGTVLAADTGEPIEGASVLQLERPHQRVRTKADGTFAIASSLITDQDGGTEEKFRVQIYPPADSPYLFQSVDRKRPDDGSKSLDVQVKLSRGVMIEGSVVEHGTQRPVVGANLYARQQESYNLSLQKGSRPWYTGTEMKYATDDEGKFRMPAWYGPGYLLVQAPTIDYVHGMVTAGERHYGKPGLQREYYDGALKVLFKKGETPEPVLIELERGATLERKVVLPDGQPAAGKLMARSYLTDAVEISGSIPALSIERGLIKLPGFSPKESNPLFLIDFEHHCGLTVSPTENEIGLAAPPIQLQPCGSARFRFVDDEGEPRAEYEPWLHLIITPGATATHHIEPNQPLWCDSVIWQNVTRPGKAPKADAEGRAVVPDLIPGATYRLGYVGKTGTWDEGEPFTIESGKTLDLGDVVIPNHR
jgi:beta-lactamase regulating signal transducer with metallopeptidase domain